MAAPKRRGTSSSPRKPAARKSASPRGSARPNSSQGPPSLTTAHVKGFIVGSLAGLLIGAGGVVYLTKEGIPDAGDAVMTSGTDEDSTPKPRFDFYTLLPNQDLGLTRDIEPADLTRLQDSSDLYVLQAGSFKQRADANRRRGELALLGLEGTIEETNGSNGRWFRIYIGPFESRSAMARARSVTAQESIDTLLLKRPRTP